MQKQGHASTRGQGTELFLATAGGGGGKKADTRFLASGTALGLPHGSSE